MRNELPFMVQECSHAWNGSGESEFLMRTRLADPPGCLQQEAVLRTLLMFSDREHDSLTPGIMLGFLRLTWVCDGCDGSIETFIYFVDERSCVLIVRKHWFNSDGRPSAYVYVI